MKKTNNQAYSKPLLVLAPLAGYTDSAFRVICLENGADLIYTEMISAEALSRDNKKTLKMLDFLPEEKNVVVQLFGKNPESFKKAVKIIQQLKAKSQILPIKFIDINFGCPAHKVFKTGAGAALMDNKKLAREIIQSVLDNTNLPVSIKIRSQVKNTTAEEFIEFIKDLNFKMVMVHGRTLSQGMAGPVDFAMIKKVKEILRDKLVLGNGGLDSKEKIKEMIKKTGVDGVGIGRGALGNPWIFNERLAVNINSISSTIIRQARLFLQYNNSLIPLRKHLVHYFKGQKNASEWRQKLIKIKTLKDLEKILF